MSDVLPIVSSLLPANQPALNDAAVETTQAASGQPFRLILQQQAVADGEGAISPDADLASQLVDPTRFIDAPDTLTETLASGNPLPPGGNPPASGLPAELPLAGEAAAPIAQAGFGERLLSVLRASQPGNVAANSGGDVSNVVSRSNVTGPDQAVAILTGKEPRQHPSTSLPNTDQVGTTAFAIRAEQQVNSGLNLSGFLPTLLRGAREVTPGGEVATVGSTAVSALTNSSAALGGYVGVANASPTLLPQDPATTSLPTQYSQLGLPLQHENWSKEFAERMVWMTGNHNSAQLRLNPAELGTIDVQIHINDDDARIVFSTQHGAVREAIESAMPRLREMLEGQGLNLVDVNVNERHASPQQGDDGRQHTAHGGSIGDLQDSDNLEQLVIAGREQWLRPGLDVFA